MAVLGGRVSPGGNERRSPGDWLSRELSWLRWVPTGRFSLSWATGGGVTRGGWRRRCVVRQQTDSNVARRWFAFHLCSIEVSINLGETSGMAGRREQCPFVLCFAAWVWPEDGVSVSRESRGFSDVVGGETAGRLVAVSDWRRSYFWAVLPPCCPVRIGRSGSKSPLILPRPTLSLGRRRPGDRKCEMKMRRLQLGGLGGGRVG